MRGGRAFRRAGNPGEEGGAARKTEGSPNGAAGAFRRPAKKLDARREPGAAGQKRPNLFVRGDKARNAVKMALGRKALPQARALASQFCCGQCATQRNWNRASDAASRQERGANRRKNAPTSRPTRRLEICAPLRPRVCFFFSKKRGRYYQARSPISRKLRYVGCLRRTHGSPVFGAIASVLFHARNPFTENAQNSLARHASSKR